MRSTYRGPACRGPMKRTPVQDPYEEGPFEIMREGPFRIVFLQKASSGDGRGSTQGAF